jgi:hypothetical protein
MSDEHTYIFSEIVALTSKSLRIIDLDNKQICYIVLQLPYTLHNNTYTNLMSRRPHKYQQERQTLFQNTKRLLYLDLYLTYLTLDRLIYG